MENTKEFMIHLGSVRDVEDFVRISTAQLYPVTLDDGQHRVNGKSFMEMFTINFTQPLLVEVAGKENEAEFARAAKRFLVCA